MLGAMGCEPAITTAVDAPRSSTWIVASSLGPEATDASSEAGSSPEACEGAGFPPKQLANNSRERILAI